MTKHTVIVRIEGKEYCVEVGDLHVSPVTALVDGVTYQVVVEPSQPAAVKKVRPVAPPPLARHPEIAAPPQNAVTAPMPGDIVEVKVTAGQQVRAGDALCVLDAMKMKNTIYAPQDGRIASVEAVPGQPVDYGTVLVRFA